MGVRSRAFTLIELAATVVCAGALFVAAPAAFHAAAQPEPKKPVAPPPGKAGDPPAPVTDPKEESVRLRARMVGTADNLRQIGQGLIVWGNNHQDHYPLPSEDDASNFTVQAAKPSKDTTANIMSSLVYGGFCKPTVLVSAAETNPNIEVCKNYAFKEPPTAVSPTKAVWDPALAADFTGGKKGNVSYAHLCPNGERLSRWSSTFSTTEPVLADRGPEIKAATYSADNTSVTTDLVNPSSNRLKYSEGRGTWSGHLFFNDGHVEFKDTTLGDKKNITDKDLGRKYAFIEDRTRPDLWFYDEADDKKVVNDYLGIFTTSGRQRSEWTAIWD